MSVTPYAEDGSKREQVERMFDAISPKYDLLNRVFSMGIDQRWRRLVVRKLGEEPDGRGGGPERVVPDPRAEVDLRRIVALGLDDPCQQHRSHAHPSPSPCPVAPTWAEASGPSVGRGWSGGNAFGGGDLTRGSAGSRGWRRRSGPGGSLERSGRARRG